MLDIGDPAFKLFGKTIPLFSADELSGDSNNAALNSKNSEKGQVEQKSSDGSVLKDELDADNETASKKGFNRSDDQNAPNSTDENSAAESDEKEQSKNSSDKTLKKPDKILPCPRCNSMDTKFCYFNNYNVNQPRHFCKSCQRYWTAGGMMRKVPVGAGRRKNKTATSSKYCHLSISEALQAESGLKTNGTVLSFGADSPLCDSMASMMSLREKKIVNVGIMEEDAPKIQTIPFPGFYPVMPIYPVPYWNGAVKSWNMPFVSPCLMSPKSPVSPKLGKHLREDDILMTPADVGSPRVLVPKTLRIDDPEEAAKSSIWTTLGIKKAESAGNDGFFKGLESKSDKNHKIESFPVLDSNPAALARSVSFRETV